MSDPLHHHPPSSTPASGRPPNVLRVAAFTAGVAVPSARFRVRQMIAALAQAGVEMRESYPRSGGYPPARRWLRPLWAAASLAERVAPVLASRRADCVLLQREMMSTLVTLEGFTGTPRFLDVDDAVHLYRGGRTMRRIAQLCDHVICGNRWLAQVYADYGRPVTVLPTAVDAGAVPATPLPDGRFRIGWIGTEGNLRYLRDWGDALRRLAQDRPEIEIAVCSDGRPDLSWLGPRVVHVPWSPAVETGFLSSLSGGLMPLPDRDWERGKCALKMLQYMAAARPVVVSPIGMNADLLGEAEIGFAARTGAEAAEALSLLASDPDRAARLGRSGRDLVERRYDVSRIAPRLAAILRVGTGESR